MTYVNLDMKDGASRRGGSSLNTPRGQAQLGFMPLHIFFKILFSALAAMLAVHFWRQR